LKNLVNLLDHKSVSGFVYMDMVIVIIIIIILIRHIRQSKVTLDGIHHVVTR